MTSAQYGRGFGSWRVLVAFCVGAATVALLGGCAMSEAAYHRLSASVGSRNDERSRKAEEDLRRQGWTRTEDREFRNVMVDEAVFERCAQSAGRAIDSLSAVGGAADGGAADVGAADGGAADRGAADGGAGAMDDRVRAIVSAPTRDGVVSKALEVTTSLDAACAFFRGRTPTLQVTKADGSGGTLVRTWPKSLARNGAGEIVEVAMQPRVVHRRKVLVERTCNFMPSVEPQPRNASVRNASVAVRWGNAPALRTITLTVDHEELDMECTDKVY